jgi:thiol-disulfide isomerase/thioredoxin
MKRFLFPASLGLALLTFASCEQDNRIAGCTDPFAINFNPSVQVSDDDGSCVYPKQERLGMIADFTATWCGPCGDWGLPAFKEAAKQTSNKAVALAVHAGGSDLAVAESEALNDAFGITGIPTLLANGTVDASSAGPLVTAVNDFITQDAQVSAAAIVSIDEAKGSADIIAQTRWFEEMTGQMYLAIYVVEDSIENAQNTGSGSQVINHDHVLRAEVTGQEFGTMVLNGEAWSGKTETFEVSVDLDPAWNMENTHFAMVLWREGVSGKEFINASFAIEE